MEANFNAQPAEVSLLLDKRHSTVPLYRWPKRRQRNGLYHGHHTVSQVNQHHDLESFSSSQQVCLDPWAIAGLRHKLMEARAFLLLNYKAIKYFFPYGVWTEEQYCSHEGLSTKYLGEKGRNFPKHQLQRQGLGTVRIKPRAGKQTDHRERIGKALGEEPKGTAQRSSSRRWLQRLAQTWGARKLCLLSSATLREKDIFC